MTHAIGTGALDTPSEQLLLSYFNGTFDADQVLTITYGPESEITNAGFNKTEDDPAMHLARRLYKANAQLSYVDLKNYMTQLTGYPPKLWELIFADQLKCTKENIESALQYGSYWDDSGDYLSSSLQLAKGLHQYILNLDYEGLWAFLDEKVIWAGEEAMRVEETPNEEGNGLGKVLWEDWDDAAAVMLGDYACDGIGDMLLKLGKLMMALKYGE